MVSESLQIDDAAPRSPLQEFGVRLLARWAMPAIATILLLSGGLAAVGAAGWPLIHDAPLIHYVVFLMEHGRAPYRDIIEMNMPGTYMVEQAAMHVFGGDARGWWLYDLVLAAAGIAASAWIAGQGRRSSGIAAGAMAYLIHLREGPVNLGQRDWLIAAILLAAFGCMFEAIRRERPAWMAGFMGLCGLAASIKPPVLVFGIGFLLATCWVIRRRTAANPATARPRWPRYAAWAVAGGIAPTGMVAGFLLSWGVTREFLAMVHGLLPWYATLQTLPLKTLVHYALLWNRSVFWVVAGGCVVTVLGRHWKRWETGFLAAAAVLGAGLFVTQGKGWPYHLYTETAFGLLWGMVELGRALEGRRKHGWVKQAVAVVTLAGVAILCFPRVEKFVANNTFGTETVSHLESDLNSLGGAGLSGKVQCLDMTQGGCINTLYRMKLVQSTGSVYDFYLFPKQGNAVTAELQRKFLRQLALNRPAVIVLSSHTWPGDTFSYEQLQNWPELAALLSAEYRLDRELPKPQMGAGYRIYVLN